MKKLILVLCLFTLFSCDSNEKEKATKTNAVYDMYEPSEMALLMNQMYAHNLQVKKDILAGKKPNEFPLDFLKIHTAELSDFKSRNDTFKSFSVLFIESEKEIYSTSSELPLRDRFNNAIGVCVSCHQTECTGPIPKIKKLLIQ